MQRSMKENMSKKGGPSKLSRLWTVEKPKKLRAMSGFDLFLRILQIYNSDNFHGGQPERFRSICHALFDVVLIFLLLVLVVLSYWRCIERKTYMDPAAIPLILAGFHIISTHISCVLNNETISRSIECLQRIIDTCKSHIRFRCELETDVFLCVLNTFPGCKNRADFERVEAMHSKLTSNILKIAIGTTVLNFLVSAMFPVSHAIRGHPKPDQWIRPIEIQ